MGADRGRGSLVTIAVLVATVLAASACGPPEPYIRYTGSVVRRAPKPVESMAVYRTGQPNGGFQDLGTVIVTCPSQARNTGFGAVAAEGGCTYPWAVRAAAKRAASVGADGIYAIESQVNAGGAVVSLTASTFMYTHDEPEPAPKPPAPPEDTSVEARLRRLEKLKADQLITPEEYEKKRAEILKEI